jgi:malic enzyme
MDSRGVISAGRELDDYKQELAWPEELAASLELNDAQRKILQRVVAAYEPTVLIGASGQGGAFDEETIRTMAAATESPVILPMSNPTAISAYNCEAVCSASDRPTMCLFFQASVSARSLVAHPRLPTR